MVQVLQCRYVLGIVFLSQYGPCARRSLHLCMYLSSLYNLSSPSGKYLCAIYAPLFLYYIAPRRRSKYYESRHEKTNKISMRPAKTQDQPRHPPSLIRVLAVRVKKPWVLSYPLSAQRIRWSGWAHTHFVGFVMSWLLSYCHFCPVSLIHVLQRDAI